MLDRPLPQLPSSQPAAVPVAELSTGDTFSVSVTAVSAPGDTVYTAKEGTFFLFRRMLGTTPNGSTVVVQVEGDTWFIGDITADTTVDLISNVAVPPGAVVSAFLSTGSDVQISGWGISAQGGDTWWR